MVVEAIRRWNWINGFLTASLHALIAYLQLQPSVETTFTDVAQRYARQVRNQLNGLEMPRIRVINDSELAYIFHLESELWGADAESYMTFFPTSDGAAYVLQSFSYVLSFFLLERCLALFLPASSLQRGRRSRRRYLFGKRDGIFSVRHGHLLSAMGPPFYLWANTMRASALCNSDWEALGNSSIPTPLRKFYIATCKKEHFADIIEASFISARKKHLKKTLAKDKQLGFDVRAWWYDVLWNYSESVRYNPFLPAKIAQEAPYYWNRNIRWFTSLALTGLLSMIGIKTRIVQEQWDIARTNSSVLHILWNDNERFAVLEPGDAKG